MHNMVILGTNLVTSNHSIRVHTDPGKSWNLKLEFSRPGKSWNQT